MNKKTPSVSIIIPMMNAETTILLTIESLLKQTYPIKEIIVVDNASTDTSVATVEEFKRRNKKVSIELLINRRNKGVGGSYNRGVKSSSSEYIILMHSDSVLQSKKELELLIKPFFKDPTIVATYSSILLPKKVWSSYNFWQKVLFARSVDKKQAGLNTKFDCIKRNVFDSIGGFDAKNYGHHIGVGSEDAAIHFALRSKGRVVKSLATVVHLHYLGPNFSVSQFFERKKLLARSYGRLIRMEGLRLGTGVLLLLIKPILLLSLIASIISPFFLIPIFLYIIVNDWGVYSRIHGDFNIRIVLLPFITFILILFEAYWTIESFLYLNRRSV